MRRAIMLSVCFLLVLTGLGGPAAAKRVALVIGNSAYTQTAPLANPANDAKDMAAALKRLGFETNFRPLYPQHQTSPATVHPIRIYENTA